MIHHRLLNESAFQMAAALLATIQNCLRPEEHRDAFEVFYEQCRDGLLNYEAKRQRMQQRLRPSAN